MVLRLRHVLVTSTTVYEVSYYILQLTTETHCFYQDALFDLSDVEDAEPVNVTVGMKRQLGYEDAEQHQAVKRLRIVDSVTDGLRNMRASSANP